MKFWMILIICVIITPWFWQVQTPSKALSINLANDISEAKILVEWKRGKTFPSPVARLFINWPLELINQRVNVVMENLDIGNYVFAGHPRERVGVVEVQKLFLFQVILYVVGFGNLKFNKYSKYLLLYFSLALVGIFLFKLRSAFETLILAPPLVFMMALGIEKFLTFKKKWLFIFCVFALVEISMFLVFQRNG